VSSTGRAREAGRSRAAAPRGRRARWLRAAPLLAVVAAVAACQSGKSLKLPRQSDLKGIYGRAPSVHLNGNVVTVRVRQSTDQLRRGGALWAKVGPYIYLFSPQTQKLFGDYDGVAAVRVTTVDGSGHRVARATLLRDELTSVTWKDALLRVAHARTQGTAKPGYLDQLVQYGEDHTTFEYDPRYVKPS
jgi:hypothetical protein